MAVATRSGSRTSASHPSATGRSAKASERAFFGAQRRVADQGFLSLTKSWPKLSMNPSTGSGGACFGDSGGPHFLGNSNRVVSITVTGDRFCRATDARRANPHE